MPCTEIIFSVVPLTLTAAMAVFNVCHISPLAKIKGASPFEPTPEKEGKDVKPLPGFNLILSLTDNSQDSSKRFSSL